MRGVGNVMKSLVPLKKYSERRFFLLALLASLFTAACADGPAGFSAPLAPLGDATFDHRLIGTSYQLPQHTTEDVHHIIAVAPGRRGHLKITSTLVRSHRDELTGDPTELFFTIGDYDLYQRAEFRVHAVTIEGETYFVAELQYGVQFFRHDDEQELVSYVDMSELSPERAHLLARARIDDTGVMVLETAPRMFMSKLGFDAREISCGTECRLFVYDLSSAEQMKLIQSVTSERIFSEFGRYSRRDGEDPASQDD